VRFRKALGDALMRKKKSYEDENFGTTNGIRRNLNGTTNAILCEWNLSHLISDLLSYTNCGYFWGTFLNS
jgi:hypothetical protein